MKEKEKKIWSVESSGAWKITQEACVTTCIESKKLP